MFTNKRIIEDWLFLTFTLIVFTCTLIYTGNKTSQEIGEVVVIHPNTTFVGMRYPHKYMDKGDYCYLNKECHKLSEVVVYEARSEPTEGRVAVASVVLNRRDSGRWGNTITSVVEAHKQFSYLSDKHLQKPPTKKDWQEALQIAYNVLYLEEGRIENIDHYHTTSISPYWSKSLKEVLTVGNHVFYSSLN